MSNQQEIAELSRSLVVIIRDMLALARSYGFMQKLARHDFDILAAQIDREQHRTGRTAHNHRLRTVRAVRRCFYLFDGVPEAAQFEIDLAAVESGFRLLRMV